MSDWKVDDKVQLESKDSVRDGVIVSIAPPLRERGEKYWELSAAERAETYPQATVKWNDGGESVISVWELSVQDSELERQFRIAAKPIMQQINEKLSLASRALDEAENLAEEHGIPFGSNISPLSQSYTPGSFSDKWADVDSETVESITGAYPGGQWGGSGWEHSAVC